MFTIIKNGSIIFRLIEKELSLQPVCNQCMIKIPQNMVLQYHYVYLNCLNDIKNFNEPNRISVCRHHTNRNRQPMFANVPPPVNLYRPPHHGKLFCFIIINIFQIRSQQYTINSVKHYLFAHIIYFCKWI